MLRRGRADSEQSGVEILVAPSYLPIVPIAALILLLVAGVVFTSADVSRSLRGVFFKTNRTHCKMTDKRELHKKRTVCSAPTVASAEIIAAVANMVRFYVDGE